MAALVRPDKTTFGVARDGSEVEALADALGRMIFGAAALYAAAGGEDWGPPLMLTAAAGLFGVATSPFARWASKVW